MSSFSKIFQIFSKGFCKSLVLYFSFYLIFSPLFSFQAFAQSLPINPISNNATLGTSSNNIPVLNITKPTAAGVSVNKFNDFNVGAEGLIVNNLNLQDYNVTYKSALSNQHVEFNPNFRDGDAAKIILNEVVSNSKTLMNGYTEIYGRKADYIVANPNGITCNGCGFINTSRLSLITGSSNIVNGDIENFNIAPTAELRINGVGAENFAFYSSSPADLVSNAIKISGNILSNSDLRILSGNDKYDWKNQAVSSNSNVNTELAVDVSALGGIKAGNIKIIATQKGFGINLDGDVIADTDNIEITADGEIKVKNLVAQNNIVATSNDKITAIDNGELVSNNLIYFDAGNILLNKSKLVSNDIYLLSNGDLINNTGIVNSNNDLFIGVNGNFVNSSNIISKHDFELQVLGNISNKKNANLIAYNDFDIITNNDLENIGKINTGNNLFISALNLNNYGQLLSNYDMDLYIGNDLINYRGSGILAGNDMQLYIGNNLINYKADIYAGRDLTIEGRDDLNIDYQALDTNKTYDNPYIEEETDPNTTVVNIPFTYTDTPADEDVNLTLTLANGEVVDIPPSYIKDDAKAGDKFTYKGYTFILGEESITEIDVPNPAYQTCVDDECDGIPQTIKKTIYNYSGTDKFTIKDSNGNNISYTETIPAGDPNDEEIVLDSTNVVDNNVLDNFKSITNNYPFINNFLNNFVNYAGQIEAKRNIEISANSITNKGFDYNTGDKAITKHYHKIRSEACGWLCGWKVLGQEEIDSVNLNSLPSRILSGGKLVLNAFGDILNQNSILSSKGDMILKAKNLQNLTTSEIANLSVNKQRIVIKRRKLKIGKHHENKTEISKKRVYNKQRSTILAGGNLSIESSEHVKNDQDVNPNGDIVATLTNKNIEEAVIPVDIELPVGNNGRFKISEGGKYLIENNVPFINVENYIGSGYFFDGLGNILDGIDTVKILGDPAYETKIIMDAIVRSTQQHYLANDGSIGSDAEQMKQLYDNALEVREELGLKVGIALNKSQITNLKKDIIWYVTKEVNGEKVLVPELYLSQATLDAIDNNNGSKISGFNVGIESDYVSNYGNITSNNILSVKSNSLVNESNDDQVATMKSKRLTTIDSKNIANLSGNIEGKITQIKSDNLVNQTKVLSSDYDDKYELKKHTEIAANTATISGEKGLSIEANNALINSGAKIESKDGDVNIKAGTATFNTIQLHNRSESQSKKSGLFSKKTSSSIKDTIENKESEINAGGNFTLTTSGDANFVGTNVNAAQDALLDIGGNINITAVKDKEYNYSNSSKSSMISSSKNNYSLSEKETLTSSKFNVGNNLNILTNKDINVIGSELNAGGDINIKADTATFSSVELHNRSESQSKKSGLFSKKTSTSIKDTIENKESEINAGGNFTLKTTDDANFAGANITVGQDALLDIGGNTNITAVKDRDYNYNKTSKSKFGGLYTKKDTVIDDNEMLKGSNVTVKDGLNIVSNKDINVVASNIDVGGDANLLAGYKLTENGVEKTENDANVNIINDTEISKHYEKHEKTNALNGIVNAGLQLTALSMGIPVGLDVDVKNAKVSANVDIAKKSSSEENKTENKVVFSNLNVEGNLTIGATKDINIKASNLNSNQDITLKSGNDINILNDYDTVSKENIRKDITVSAGANVGNSYVDTVNATKDFYNATKAVSDAKENLNKIKDARNNGKASNEAVKDAEYNLSLALINLANAEIGLASSVSGAATAAASSFGTGMYASVSSNNDINKHTDNYTSMQSVASNVSGENVYNSADNDLNQIGSNVIANGTVSYNVLNKLKVLAGENTYTSSSSDEHIVAGASYGNNAVQLNAGYDKSTNRAHGTNYTSSNTNANNILIATGSDAEFSGANVNANETLIASIGGNLSLESKQDTDYAKGKSFGFNTSGGVGVEGGTNGKNSSGFGVNSSSSYHDSAWVNDMTELTGKNVDINVAGKTSLTGAMIDGSESLHLATNELEFKDIHDFDKTKEDGFGLSTSVGISTDKEKTTLHPNGETSLTLKDTGNDKEQITHATIGEGVIEVAQGSDLTGLNRDTTKAQEITKDMTTGALDASASIDNRVFTSEGREDIVKDHKKAISFIENISENLYNSMAEDTKFSDALKSVRFEEVSKKAVENILSKENGVEILAIISGQERATVEEKDKALSIFASEIASIYGVDVGDVKTMLTKEKVGGSFDKDNKDIYLNDLYVGDNIETGLGVLGHETGHSVYGDNEDTANYIGSRFTDAYIDGLWINGVDSKLGSWSSGDTNPLYIAQNNVDYAKVENKDDCGPLCLTVFGIGAIISGIGAYKGGEAKAIVDYGYLGNNEYMRPDGTRILGEDLETNLKIYGTMDIGGSILMSAAFFMEGSSVEKSSNISKFENITKKGAKENNYLTDITRKQVEKNLKQSGFKGKVVNKEHNIILYEKEGEKFSYTVRDYSKSGGKTLEVLKDGNVIEKIRLGD